MDSMRASASNRNSGGNVTLKKGRRKMAPQIARWRRKETLFPTMFPDHRPGRSAVASTARGTPRVCSKG